MASTVSECLRQALARQAELLSLDRATEGDVNVSTTGMAGRHPEEALRVLMTSLYPRMADNRAKPGDAEGVAALLCEIEPMAGHSLRFLDAFNNFWNIARTRSPLTSCAAWPAAVRAYAGALDAYRLGANLEAERDIWSRSFRSSRWPALEGAEACMPVSRVLVLADNSFVGWRILRQVSKVAGIEAHVLICRSERQSFPAFAVRQAAGTVLAARNSMAIVPSVLRRNWTWLPLPLHHEKVIRWIEKRQFDVGLHGMGVIYRKAALNAFSQGILNSHIGYLPTFRGRSVVEWSLLAEAPLGASVFFIDDGIDTGERLVAWRPASERLPAQIDDLRRALFDADGDNYATALQALQHRRICRNEVTRGWRFYVMSELLRNVAQQALNLRNGSPVAKAKVG